MSDVAIKIENLSKQYRLGVVSTGTLSHDLNRWWTTKILRKEDPYLKIGEVNDRATKGSSEYVWALKDINMEIKQGDVVGIIGKNGAGKSTLLKLLSRVTAPTTGTIKYKGRIASLLEVGTGFHPEMTGRENIYMNGAIMGMSRAEITHKLDEIVDFSGCERYLDTPVKRYSSGMTVRLGFAIAAHIEPDILVVDEVLAVGDAEFQKKAIGKMQDVSKGEGRTVLFVSHNMASVRTLCRNAYVLHNGGIEYHGEVGDSIEYYVNKLNKKEKSSFVIVEDKYRVLNKTMYVKFLSMRFLKENCTFASDENIDIQMELLSQKDVEYCRINCTICDIEGTPIGSNTSFDTFPIRKGEKKSILYRIKKHNLVNGVYSMSFSVGTGNASIGETNYDVVKHVLLFEVDKMRLNASLYYSKWDKSWGKIFFESSMLEL